MDIFYMPTKVIHADNCILDQGDLFSSYGKKALIVTGKTSAIKSGALDDVSSVLKQENIRYEIFNKIMENPTYEILDEAWKKYKLEDIDFVIGIGGGSPLDACKMIAVLLANDLSNVRDLGTNRDFKNLPIITVPTTSGTGSETTPYSIITDHQLNTKVTCAAKVFPNVSLIDVKYYMSMPESIIRSTAVDALSHLIEGYVTVKANIYSDQLALSGLSFFEKAMDGLLTRNYTKDFHLALVHASTLAGMVISHSGTGIPHGMGYHLTYFHGEKHGKASALFQSAMLNLHAKHSPRSSKVNDVLHQLNLHSTEELKRFILDVVGEFSISEKDLLSYSRSMSVNKRKLTSHDFDISYQDIEAAYRYSLRVK